MKKIWRYMLATMTAAAAAAQPVRSAAPAPSADSLRLLTMEEAVLGKGLAVPNLPCVWCDEGAVYTCSEGEVLYAVDALSLIHI